MDKLQLARMRLSLQATYLNRVLWSLQPVPTPELGTLGVDARLRLYYDPEYMETLTLDETVAVLVHEVHHVLRDHSTRAPKQAQGMDWNIAADAEINDDLGSEGYTLPGSPMPKLEPGQKGYIMPACLGMAENLTAEEYYARIKNIMDKQAMENTTGEGTPRRVGEGACGSVADGKGQGHELGSDDPKNPGVGTLERDLIRRGTAQDILDAAKQQGNVPASLARWAKEHLHSEVDWRRELAAIVRRHLARARGSVDYTYHKPSTRRTISSEGKDFILPSMYAPVPNIAVVVDTSGSISDKDLAQAMAEVEGILKKANAIMGVHLIACDSEATYCGRILDAKAAQGKLTGGGGTDMGVGIRMAEQYKAEITVVLTDGYTGWPSEAPRTRVIVCLIGAGSQKVESVPPWARALRIG